MDQDSSADGGRGVGRLREHSPDAGCGYGAQDPDAPRKQRVQGRDDRREGSDNCKKIK